jgi:hypothetical protein
VLRRIASRDHHDLLTDYSVTDGCVRDRCASDVRSDGGVCKLAIVRIRRMCIVGPLSTIPQYRRTPALRRVTYPLWRAHTAIRRSVVAATD